MRKQQFYSRPQQQQQQQQQNSEQIKQQQPQKQSLAATSPATAKPGRPLSISSVSSAASSGSSSSANSSASSGIQSSLTRNGSLNYGLEYRRCAYLASIESLNNSQHSSSGGASNGNGTQSIEETLRNLYLSPSGHFKDAASARAAILAAGAQSRAFGPNSQGGGGGGQRQRINRSLHASLRYDKSTAYRIHLMANARANLLNNNGSRENQDQEEAADEPRGARNSISRNNSSTSSDSGHQHLQIDARISTTSSTMHSFRTAVCRCGSTPSITSSSSQTNDSVDEKQTLLITRKAATLDSSSFQRSSQHHHHQQQQHRPDCSYSSRFRPMRASAKLQPSPSSVSSHSNNSSLFRDDGFEDDLTSTGSDNMSTTTNNNHYNQHHRLSFQGRSHQIYCCLYGQRDRRHLGHEDEDDYQSCEEEFTANSHTTASTTSNLDDCALSTTSSSMMTHHEQLVLDKISLANAKQQYRKSLLLEHQQQQHLLHAQHIQSQNKIQSLISTTPKICQLVAPSSNHHQSANTSATQNTSCTSPTKQTKCDDRTVNIIGHMPTKNPGYWDSNLSITQRVVTEIIETERTYVDDLEQIVTGYICYLRNVLKQQKHNQSQNVDTTAQKHKVPSNSTEAEMVMKNTNDDDDKSMLVFDDDTTSATNEVEEDYDVEESDDISMKENVLNNTTTTLLKQPEANNHEACTNDGAIMTANHIKNLFSNLEDIYKFNKDLLFRLEECYLNPSSVAECFVENAPGFEVYTHYCTMYPQVVSTLTELMGNPTSAQLLKERQNELSQSLPLGAYLLKPVQRILKYHILFQSLIKHTNDDNTISEKDRQLIGEAFSVMTSIACHINAMKKRHEHAIRVQEVQGLLSGWEGPDLTTLGELILEDTFKLYNRPKSSRHLFLFENVLLITKKKRDGSLCYKGHIACSNLMLIEKIEGQPLVFNTVPFDNPKALCAFQAKHIDKKRDWCLQMKDVIIKSFEVKIPVHVRDILMSLTTSNTTDTNCTKSSSENTRAIRAPNYLEKMRARKR